MQSTVIQSDATRAGGARRAFTLIEVLIAAIILAIGLIGLAAVFPVVITQQRDATDLSMAVSAGDSGEAILATRLGNFSATIADIPEGLKGEWLRISAFDTGRSDEAPYLQMPFGNNLDLRLSRLEENVPARGRNTGALMTYSAIMRHRPLSERPGDKLEVRISVNLANGKQQSYWLRPDGNEKFITQPGFENRLAVGPNGIDYDRSRLSFNVVLNDGESVRSALIDYTWLDERLLAHEDRLSPSERPRYAWEVCVRKGLNGQAQYCLFMYRFDGPKDTEFQPLIPSSQGKTDDGMLRLGKFRVIFNKTRRAYFVEDPTGREEQRGMAAGTFLLPRDGSGPVKVLRSVTLDGTRFWELDAPPTRVDKDGVLRILIDSDEEFWFLPRSVFLPVDQVTWKITPLLAYTKQVDL